MTNLCKFPGSCNQFCAMLVMECVLCCILQSTGQASQHLWNMKLCSWAGHTRLLHIISTTSKNPRNYSIFERQANLSKIYIICMSYNNYCTMCARHTLVHRWPSHKHIKISQITVQNHKLYRQFEIARLRVYHIIINFMICSVPSSLFYSVLEFWNLRCFHGL